MRYFCLVSKCQWTNLLVLSLISMGQGFKQKLWLYLEGGNALYFDTNIRDMSDYNLFLPKVKKICAKGVWVMYRNVNYEQHYKSWGFPHSSKLDCIENVTITKIKSLRHLSTADILTDSISLYTGTDFCGNETSVRTQARTGIKTQINSFSITGTSEWMLFEGKNLDGKYVCFPVSYQSDFYIKNVQVQGLNLDTIGSVFKGCDLNEIHHYKRNHKKFFYSNQLEPT